MVGNCEVYKVKKYLKTGTSRGKKRSRKERGSGGEEQDGERVNQDNLCITLSTP